MYGKMTTHAVQKTVTHRISAKGNLYSGESRMITQRETKATVKK